MADENGKPGNNSKESAARSGLEGGKDPHLSCGPLPKIDFSMFVFSLNSSVLVNLGIIDDPATGTKTQNLPAAKQTIDILCMLQEKTKGNLTKEEEELLKHILYDLRMIYVKQTSK
jgi:hypothetical protein